MKTAISVEDSLMQQADTAARNLGLSRSALISQALREYLVKCQRQRTIDLLNKVYAEEPPSADETKLVRKLPSKMPALERW